MKKPSKKEQKKIRAKIIAVSPELMKSLKALLKGTKYALPTG